MSAPALIKNRIAQEILSRKKLEEGESYVGTFNGYLQGIIARIPTSYQVVLTNRRVFFGEATIGGSLSKIETFSLSDIRSVTVSNWMLIQNKVTFSFTNGNVENVKTPKFVLGNFPGTVLTEELKAFLERIGK